MSRIKRDKINELESFVLEQYNAEVLNIAPKTEKELLELYRIYSDVLYQYVRLTVNHFIHSINNELRAVLGHLAEYRISETSPGKRDLEKAYGHFRRMNLDALKILCDEFDKSLSGALKKQCKYDCRDVRKDYLLEFGQQYIVAKNFYIKAQQEERVGCDSHAHNIIALYYEAAKKYIILKNFYQRHKKQVKKVQFKSIVIKALSTIFALLGIAVSVGDLFFNY